jgi:MoaA/NifB/PqqE/SkfB family radical SAM enzyme
MDSLAEVPARFRSAGDVECRIPIHVVWELTLACDLKCIHCGSRAGHRRISELNTRECLQIVDSFARLGTREVSLIGGEAYLRRDLPEIIQGIRSHGIYCGIQTGGRNFTAALMERAVRAGLNGLGVSLDGLEPLSRQAPWVSRLFPGGCGHATTSEKCGSSDQCEYADRSRRCVRPAEPFAGNHRDRR